VSNLFEQYPKMSEYFETSDGEKFFKEDTAKLHAKSLEDKNVKTVSRPTESPKATTAEAILKLVDEMDLETANDYLSAENALAKPRKSVVDALKAQIAELENPA